MAEITYEIKEKVGVLADNGAWETQINLISWNHGAPKYDIRKWNVETGKMSKGISLNEDELLTLRDIQNEQFGEEEEDE